MAVGMNSAALVVPWLKTIQGGGVGTSFTFVPNMWAALHTSAGDPGAAGTANNSVGDATRKQVTFTTPASNVMSMTAPPSVWTDAATTETISYISVWSLITAGSVYWTVALTTPQPWVATNTFTLSTLTFTLTPIMA